MPSHFLENWFLIVIKLIFTWDEFCTLPLSESESFWNWEMDYSFKSLLRMSLTGGGLSYKKDRDACQKTRIKPLKETESGCGLGFIWLPEGGYSNMAWWRHFFFFHLVISLCKTAGRRAFLRHFRSRVFPPPTWSVSRQTGTLIKRALRFHFWFLPFFQSFFCPLLGLRKHLSGTYFL